MRPESGSLETASTTESPFPPPYHQSSPCKLGTVISVTSGSVTIQATSGMAIADPCGAVLP
jgi:hypothetical protein